MKVLITDYSFDPVAKTVRFNNLVNVELNRILLITNATKNTIIYNFASPALGGTVSGNVLTLGTSTVGMQSTDKLQIFYENDDTPVSDQMITILNRIVASLRGPQNVDASDRQRVTVDSVNVQINAGVNNWAGFDSREAWYMDSRNTYANSIRPNLIQT
jgi:hypothetical protein